MEPYLGQIQAFGFNFAPRGWAMCNGQLLPISSNQALFSLLGTTYGGDGRSTFALPDLRGRVPIHPGRGPGLTNRVIGSRGGVEDVTLVTSEIPAHSHTFKIADGKGNDFNANGDAIANIALNRETGQANELLEIFKSSPSFSGNLALHSSSIAQTGGDQAHYNMQPYLTINFCIALQGLFPPRN